MLTTTESIFQLETMSTPSQTNTCLPQLVYLPTGDDWALHHRLTNANHSLVHLPTGDNEALHHRLTNAYQSLVYLSTGDNDTLNHILKNTYIMFVHPESLTCTICTSLVQ